MPHQHSATSSCFAVARTHAARRAGDMRCRRVLRMIRCGANAASGKVCDPGAVDRNKAGLHRALAAARGSSRGWSHPALTSRQDATVRVCNCCCVLESCMHTSYIWRIHDTSKAPQATLAKLGLALAPTAAGPRAENAKAVLEPVPSHIRTQTSLQNHRVLHRPSRVPVRVTYCHHPHRPHCVTSSGN